MNIFLLRYDVGRLAAAGVGHHGVDPRSFHPQDVAADWLDAIVTYLKHWNKVFYRII